MTNSPRPPDEEQEISADQRDAKAARKDPLASVRQFWRTQNYLEYWPDGMITKTTSILNMIKA